MKKLCLVVLLFAFSLFSLPSFAASEPGFSFECADCIGGGSSNVADPTDVVLDEPRFEHERMYASLSTSIISDSVKPTNEGIRRQTLKAPALYVYNMPATRSYEVGWR